jgi:TetR/AcrR family transcriptional regulator, transcriptional repressor for nem operon
MAREKDEAKRQAIMAVAKRLFAQRGYQATSIVDLAHEASLPVGSVYTYFENKEALLRCVVEEGWGEFFEGLTGALAGVASPERRLAIILYRMLPSLFKDVDLISILLSEGARFVSLETKLESLTSLVEKLIDELAESRDIALAFPPEKAKAALCVFLLGSLDTVRLSKSVGLEVEERDIIDFIRMAIENAFRMELPPEEA